jgi:hypothetical protein
MYKMEVVEYRFLTTNDKYDLNYPWWSRAYEYPFVLEQLQKLGASTSSKIHNTSWGFEGMHVRFKEVLDNEYSDCIHSDVRASILPKTMYYDITKTIESRYKNFFDFVINISTIEEVGHDNISIIKNLFDQVKVGGYLILTFDYDKNVKTEACGSINIDSVNEFTGMKIEKNKYMISGNNSAYIQHYYNNLNCGVLILKKV